MAELPEELIFVSTTFTNVGVDYFRPFTVKIGRMKEKQCCYLFACLKMIAVQTKVGPNLNKSIYLNAILQLNANDE